MKGALAPAAVNDFVENLAARPGAAGIRYRRGAPFAARHVLWERPEIARLLAIHGVDRLASEGMGEPAFPVDATLLDKNPAANWKVPRHQDLSLPVANKADAPGFTHWTTRLGVDYAEPPEHVLAELATLRIHLDDCPAENGALAVVSGSHTQGKIPDAVVEQMTAESFVVCAAERGDVLLMKPLIVHRSSASTRAVHRRVLQVVYATREPAESIRWRRA